jgi:transposase
MLEPYQHMKVFVALKPVDMRKQLNGLILEVTETMGDNMQDGHLYIFRNYKADRIKAIFWHRDGFVLIYKRLEKHKFCFPKLADNTCMHITATQLKWLLSGFDFTRIDDNSSLNYSEYF